ncbi:MAG: DUF5615 family PIN-like protein [Candidatus Saccharimonas sp.]|nr:DUF5615 family PIN-like protein [Planctomycetaceae bacterium]
MARTLRLHLDECCHANLFEALPLHGIDVTTAGSVQLLSESDEAQLEFARSSKRVLFTHDADFIAMHQRGIEHAGIAYCDRRKRTVGEMARLLVLLWELYDTDEMVNRLEYL